MQYFIPLRLPPPISIASTDYAINGVDDQKSLGHEATSQNTLCFSIAPLLEELHLIWVNSVWFFSSNQFPYSSPFI